MSFLKTNTNERLNHSKYLIKSLFVNAILSDFFRLFFKKTGK